MILVPEYEVSLESQDGELRYVITYGEPKLIPDDFYKNHLLDMLLIMIRKDGEIIKKKYC